MDVEGAGVVHKVGLPDGFHEPLPAENLARMGHEHLEQLGLFGGQAVIAVVAADGSLFGVEGERAGFEDGAFGGGEEPFDAVDEFADGEGEREDDVGAERRRAGAIGRADIDEGDAGGGGAEELAGADAAGGGAGGVDDDDVGPEAGEEVASPTARSGDGDFIVFASESGRKRVGYATSTLNQKNMGWGVGH